MCLKLMQNHCTHKEAEEEKITNNYGNIILELIGRIGLQHCITIHSKILIDTECFDLVRFKLLKGLPGSCTLSNGG